MFFFPKLFGDAHQRYLKKLRPTVEKINALEKKFEAFSRDQFKAETSRLKKEIKQGASLDSILPEAFALVREAAKQTLRQRHYDEQLLGGIVLHRGAIAEMRTGEGKTLTATLPAYLNALNGKGVHIVTVNDYLARRDVVWMGQIYDFLGVSVGCLNHEQSFIYDPEYKKPDKEKDEIRDKLGGFKIVEDFIRPCSRKEAYSADITYGTNNEFGFDYLRDNMAMRPEDQSQRGFNYAILDEVDFILIDEARTPLIISRPSQMPSNLYHRFQAIVKKLRPEKDYEIDEEKKAVSLTPEGIDRVEEILGKKDIYGGEGIDYLHYLEQALRAQAINPADKKPLFAKDRDYVVRNGEVIIVDEFTGRLMPGRRWSGGLHQAIEAKEGVNIKPESQTLAQITFQNLFRMYDKLAGMTGTAVSAAEELDKVYGLDVISIPTHRPDVRIDLPDKIYKTKEEKDRALVDEVKKRNQKGQPVLLGTRSIEKNEHLHNLLKKNGINSVMLNAKNHEEEAKIIAQAGKLNAVTAATNMAGRGVDIILGGNPLNKQEQEMVKKAGGLHVIGTERHEARRIDDQLRGRAARQGDPGSSQFFLCLEDELLRVFGGERMKALMERLDFPENQPIEAKIVSRAVENAQSKIEGLHFDIRRRLLDYDNVLNRHREVFYKKRKKILQSGEKETEKNILNLCNGKKIKLERLKGEQKSKFLNIAKIIYLQVMDAYWMRHLEDMGWLRDSVRLRVYANIDPVVEYKKEGYNLFQQMMEQIKKDAGNKILSLLGNKFEPDLSSVVARKILGPKK